MCKHPSAHRSAGLSKTPLVLLLEFGLQSLGSQTSHLLLKKINKLPVVLRKGCRWMDTSSSWRAAKPKHWCAAGLVDAQDSPWIWWQMSTTAIYLWLGHSMAWTACLRQVFILHNEVWIQVNLNNFRKGIWESPKVRWARKKNNTNKTSTHCFSSTKIPRWLLGTNPIANAALSQSTEKSIQSN